MADSRPVLDQGDLHVLNVVQRQIDTAADSFEVRFRRIEAALAKLGVDFNRQFARLMQTAPAVAPEKPKKPEAEKPDTGKPESEELVNPEDAEALEAAEEAVAKAEKKVEAFVKPRRHRWI